MDNACPFSLQISQWKNPTQVLRTYEFLHDTTVYYGKVAGGTGYQVLFPEDLRPGDVLRFLDEVSLR